MPIYEYRCKGCKHEFEARVSISQRDKAACPKCKSRKTERLLSMFYSTKSDGASASSGSRCSTCSSGSCSTCH